MVRLAKYCSFCATWGLTKKQSRFPPTTFRRVLIFESLLFAFYFDSSWLPLSEYLSVAASSDCMKSVGRTANIFTVYGYFKWVPINTQQVCYFLFTLSKT